MATDIKVDPYEPERLIADMRAAAARGPGYEYILATIRIKGTASMYDMTPGKRIKLIDRVLEALDAVTQP